MWIIASLKHLTTTIVGATTVEVHDGSTFAAVAEQLLSRCTDIQQDEVLVCDVYVTDLPTALKAGMEWLSDSDVWSGFLSIHPTFGKFWTPHCLMKTLMHPSHPQSNLVQIVPAKNRSKPNCTQAGPWPSRAVTCPFLRLLICRPKRQIVLEVGCCDSNDGMVAASYGFTHIGFEPSLVRCGACRGQNGIACTDIWKLQCHVNLCPMCW